MKRYKRLFKEANKFKVSVEVLDSKKYQDVVEEKEFDSKDQANKYKKEMMKKYKLIKYAGHIVNFSDNKELFTNY